MVSYPLVIKHKHGKSPFLIGKPSINGPFPMAMLNNQRVISWWHFYRELDEIP
jgi:hypothetical protein